METLVFKHVDFSYPDSDRKALSDISFSIQESEFVLVCGRSGGGKSTLMRHMKKSLIPYGIGEGEIEYCGENLMELDARKDASEIGYVSQDPENQIVTDKVWHELAFGLENLGFPNGVIDRRVAEMASYFGIQSWFRKDTCELSGGQKQILNLAAIMAMQPKLIVLDEPTSQLDPVAATEFLNTLRRINQELGTTIVITEHRLEEVFTLADRVLLMDRSELIFDGRPEELPQFLCRQGRDDLSGMLPTPVRISLALQKDRYEIGNVPMTVREGRSWLSAHYGTAQIRKPDRVKSEKREESEAVIQLKNVWFRYDRPLEDIVRDLSVTVRKGELFALLGGNGTGKSTTLGLISGRLKAWRGKILINGRRIETYRGKELFSGCLGVLPQNPASVFTEITLEEELYEAVPEEYAQAQKLQKTAEMAEKMGLAGLEKLHPYDLSGGEKQRLALGKILLQRPQILLLDEPTKGLDPFFKKTLADIFASLKQEGMTIFMISHDIEFCGAYADRCAMLFDGNIRSADDPVAFFGGNSFYTTAANRMARHLFDEIVTCEDVIEVCGRNTANRFI